MCCDSAHAAQGRGSSKVPAGGGGGWSHKPLITRGTCSFEFSQFKFGLAKFGLDQTVWICLVFDKFGLEKCCLKKFVEDEFGWNKFL